MLLLTGNFGKYNYPTATRQTWNHLGFQPINFKLLYGTAVENQCGVESHQYQNSSHSLSFPVAERMYSCMHRDCSICLSIVVPLHKVHVLFRFELFIWMCLGKRILVAKLSFCCGAVCRFGCTYNDKRGTTSLRAHNLVLVSFNSLDVYDNRVYCSIKLSCPIKLIEEKKHKKTLHLDYLCQLHH